MTRGHDRGWFLTLVLTFMGRLFQIILGSIAALFVDILLLNFTVPEDAPRAPPRYGIILATVTV